MYESKILTLESEAGFRTLFEYATVGILVIGSDGHIELANPCLEKLFGYNNTELCGQPIEILIPEAFRKKHVHHRDTYFEKPKARPMGYGMDLHARKKDGTEFPVEISLGHYQLENEKLAVAFVTDITIRKAEEEKYYNLFENSLVAMFMTDMKTRRIIDVNEMGVHFFGYENKKEFVSNFRPEAHLVNPDERGRSILTFAQGMSDKLVQEQEMNRLDGTTFWADIFVKINHDKTIAQTVAVDITERKRSHEELESKVIERTLELTGSLEREKELNELKSRFVSMASHEFRTPLSAILSSVSLVESYKDENQKDKRKRHIERIKSSIKNLTGILDEFLSLDKLEQGKVEVIKEHFNLNDFTRDVLEEINGMLKAGQQINYMFSGDTDIMQDKRILRNVMLNLLSNAVKYSGENKLIALHIEVGETVTIRVKDEGIGIPEDDQKYLFGKFYRAKNVTGIQGTGLGLNIVKRYVELLEGSINFISRPDLGSTFIVEIPKYS